ncbi:MAG: MBG domain-containing protein, partial [Janthinobacterium lividum]
IIVSPDDVRRGTPITLNAQVTGDDPTGTVTFSYDSIVLGQSSLNGSGAATLSTSNLPVGDWYVEAFYDGDTHNAISGALGPMVHVLPPLLGSTTNLTADRTSAPYSSSITLTGVVVGNSGGGIPGGSMTFSSNDVVLGSAVIDGTGKATLSTSSLQPGSNLVHVTYSGDAAFASSVSNSIPVVINQESASLVLGNLNVSYDGNAHAATATSVPAGLSISLTYNGSAAAPTTTGSYAVVATVNDPDYTGSAAGTLVIGPGAANITLGGLNTIYDGTAHTALVATTPQGLSYAVTYDGSATPPTTAGIYAVAATVKDPNYAGSATGTLNIAKATVPVMLGALSASYDGNPHAVTATTLPALLKVNLTYNGSSTVPVAAGSYTVLGTVDDGDYSGSTTGTLVISPSSVAITWAAPAPIAYGTPLSVAQLNASASTAGNFVYSAAPGLILSSGLQIISVSFTPTDINDFSPATKAVQLLINRQGTATILTTNAGTMVPDQAITFTATVTPASYGSPTGTVSFFDGTTLLGSGTLANGSATYSTMLASGTHTLTAAYNGNTDFLASSNVGLLGVSIAPLDFTLTAVSPVSQTVITDGSTTFSYSLTPLYGTYPGPVTLAVAGLPSGVSYALSRSVVSSDAGAQQITLTVTALSNVWTNRSSDPLRKLSVWACTLLVLPLTSARNRRRSVRRFTFFLLLCISLPCSIVLTGCGSSLQTTPHTGHTYTVTVVASSAGIQHGAVSTLNLQ